MLESDCGFASCFTDLSTAQQIKDIILARAYFVGVVWWCRAYTENPQYSAPPAKGAQKEEACFWNSFISASHVFLLLLFLFIYLFWYVLETSSLPTRMLWMTSHNCCGTNAPWWTPAEPCVSQGSTVIIFSPLISQIEMDTYDKNVTATPHVSGLTGLHVTF